MSESISPYVHPIFNTLLVPPDKGGSPDQSGQGGLLNFLPFALDPLVTLTPSSTTLNFDNQLSFQDIANFIALESKTSKIKMPILR